MFQQGTNSNLHLQLATLKEGLSKSCNLAKQRFARKRMVRGCHGKMGDIIASDR